MTGHFWWQIFQQPKVSGIENKFFSILAMAQTYNNLFSIQPLAFEPDYEPAQKGSDREPIVLYLSPGIGLARIENSALSEPPTVCFLNLCILYDSHFDIWEANPIVIPS